MNAQDKLNLARAYAQHKIKTGLSLAQAVEAASHTYGIDPARIRKALDAKAAV